MDKKKYLFMEIIFVCLFAQILFVSMVSSLGHVSKDSVTSTIDEVVNWYHSALGKEKVYARQIMIEIANQESHMGTYNVGGSTYPGNTGGVGFAQFTTIAMQDIKNRLSSNPSRLEAIRARFGFDPLTVNLEDFGDPTKDIISAVFMREFLLANPSPIPQYLIPRAAFWKDRYNANPALDRDAKIRQYVDNNLYEDPQHYHWVYSGTLESGQDLYSSPFNASLLFALNSFGNLCPISGINISTVDSNCLAGRVVYNNAGCVSKIISESVATNYEYWNFNCAIKKIWNSESTFLYSAEGDLLHEIYVSGSNVNYDYYPNRDLRSIQKDGVISEFSYDSDSNLINKITSFAGLTTETNYVYDFLGRLVSINSPGKTIGYTYDSLNRTTREDFYVYDAGVFISDWVEYNYDLDGNLVAMLDNTGYNINYSLESEDYACHDLVCSGVGCSNSSWIDSICSAPVLDSIISGNEIINIDHDEGFSDGLCSSLQEECHTPLESINSDGLLIEDDYYVYNYDENYSLQYVENKLFRSYFDDPLLNSLNYSSSDLVGSMDYPDFEEAYTYDPLGFVVSIDYSLDYGSDPGLIPISGAVITNVFFNLLSLITGRAISPGDSSQRDSDFQLYLTSPGDLETKFNRQDFNMLVDRFEQEYGVIDTPRDFQLDSCLEKQDYVLFNQEIYTGHCKDFFTSVEYSCGEDLSRWDFWNVLEKVARTRSVECEFGCYEGNCLEAIQSECVLDSDCSINQSCIEGSCINTVIDEPICVVNSDCGDFELCVEGKCVLDLPENPNGF